MLNYLKASADKIVSKIKKISTVHPMHPKKDIGYTERLSGMHEENLISGERLLFICGCWRSGTTWLGRMLQDSPQLYICQHELQPYMTGYEFKQEDDHIDNHPFMAERFHMLRKMGFLSIISYFHRREKPEARLIGDRSPGGDAGQILKVFPKSKIIVVYRDGRDVCVSMAHMVETLEGPGSGAFIDSNRTALTDSFVEKVAHVYSKLMKGYIASSAQNNVLVVRYELLITHTTEVMREVFDFLDLDVRNRELEKLCQLRSFKNETGLDVGKEDTQSYSRKGVSGEWKKYFTDEQRTLYHSIAEQELRAAGYQ
jgi:hypothetical protein